MSIPFSRRLDWETPTNALAQAAEAAQRDGRVILDLTQSNPTFAGIVYEPVSEYFADPGLLAYEPNARGALSAREAVASYYNNAVHPERILLTASTSEAYSYLFKLLCDPGDEVLAPRPSYPLFEMLARLESVQVRQYALRYHDGWFIDTHDLARAITKRTRAILWVNPNNPTGSYLKTAEYAEIARLCRDHNLALVSDEVFADYGINPPAGAMRTLTASQECLTFCLSGLSKVCGLPQMKLGWMVASGPGHIEALHRLEWIADAFLSVGTPVQRAVPGLLQTGAKVQLQIRDRTLHNLQQLRRLLQGSACRVLEVEAGWYAIVKAPSIRTEEEWTLHLLERGVLVQPGFFFDFDSEPYLILSLLTEPEVFQQGVRHILNAC